MSDGQWLMNHRETELWDGPGATAGWVAKIPQWSLFHQNGAQDGGRIPVNYLGSSIVPAVDAFIDAEDVGPIDDPGANATEPRWMSTPWYGSPWLMNHRETGLWSGPGDDAEKFTDVPQWSVFQQLARQEAPRIVVYNYGAGRTIPGVAWITADDVGPIEPPAQWPPVQPPADTDEPTVISRPSPNHGGPRSRTVGCVIHSTRGAAPTAQLEFKGTLNWFSNPASQVSAHIVIGPDGTIAEVVDPDLVAWHAGVHNSSYLGIELTQPRLGDSITDSQYHSCAWWLKKMSKRYGFPLEPGNLPEHRQTPQGVSVGKTDVSLPYSYAQLKTFIDRLS